MKAKCLSDITAEFNRIDYMIGLLSKHLIADTPYQKCVFNTDFILACIRSQIHWWLLGELNEQEKD